MIFFRASSASIAVYLMRSQITEINDEEKAMHTQASKLYRETRIPTHTMQCGATMRVLMYLGSRYPAVIVDRHRAQATNAMLKIEEKMH